MKKRLFITLISCLAFITVGVAQGKLAVYATAFYNVENLWDTDDDPTNKGDDDYLPDGQYKWTPDKYQQKLHNIAVVLSQLAREYCPAGPAIIGIAEVENRRVLEDLVNTEPLRSTGYQIVHFESPDHRGIDVAALYNPKLFKFESARTYAYHNPDEPKMRTRDQLLVSGKLAGEDFHFIVNHWPSRYGGSKSSPLREFAASITRHIVDSLYTANKDAKIVICGDLNDDPFNKSVSEVLGAKRKIKKVKEHDLYNATWKLYDDGIGTLCYQGKWNLFDQQIVSGTLVNDDKSTLSFWKAEVFNRPFLIQQEGKYKGYPFRSFSGNNFIGGYADHFPTITYLVKKLNK